MPPLLPDATLALAPSAMASVTFCAMFADLPIATLFTVPAAVIAASPIAIELLPTAATLLLPSATAFSALALAREPIANAPAPFVVTMLPIATEYGWSTPVWAILPIATALSELATACKPTATALSPPAPAATPIAAAVPNFGSRPFIDAMFAMLPSAPNPSIAMKLPGFDSTSRVIRVIFVSNFVLAVCIASVSCFMVTASVSSTPSLTLTIRRVAPTSPIDTVLAPVATELTPMATEPTPEARAPEPIASVSTFVALACEPIATLFLPSALACMPVARTLMYFMSSVPSPRSFLISSLTSLRPPWSWATLTASVAAVPVATFFSETGFVAPVPPSVTLDLLVLS
ncbi:hypothetical protein BCO18175_07469 [Burkholderia contaminans]|nr:hypothetical protein BCO18175_07469 [Burkholderia contaminans]